MRNLNTKTPKTKKITLICLTVVIAAAGIYTTVAAIYSLWPFQPESSNIKDIKKEKQKDDSKSEEDKSAEDTPDPTTPPSVDPDQSVVTPPATPPSDNAPFPVENSHYRIEKNDNSHYTITLYAILNNPSQYDEYTTQLREYKKEALSYLNTRLGSTNNLTISWNPPAAKDLR